MKHPDYNFVDTAMGGVDRRNVVVTAAEVRGLLPADRVDCYCTWHRFPAIYYKHWQENVKERNGREHNSVGGYKGPSYADFLPFDVDGDTLEESQEVLARLLGYIDATWGKAPMRISYSGNRGYHLSIPASAFGGWDPSDALAQRLRGLALRIGGDLVDIDPKVYDKNRLWRITNSINSKSGRYKIQLSEAEALGDAGAIAEMAQEPRDFSNPAWDDAEPVGGLVDLWRAVCSEKKGKARTQVPVDGLFRTGLEEGGGRQQQAFDMVRQFRAWGMPPSGALAVLEMWDRGQEQSLKETDGDDELERIVQNVYGDDPGTADRITPESVLNLDDLLDKYDAYYKLTKERSVRLGIPTLDGFMRGIAPGEVCVVIAKTSVGKTAWAQNVLRNVSKTQGCESLFLSMEQPAAQALERWAQMTLGIEGREIYRQWEDDGFRPGLADELRKDAINRIWTCDLPHLKLEEVERVVWAAQGKGAELGFVVIDYLGLLDVKDLERSLYGQISEAARALKTLAKNLKMAVMALCQISRSPDDHGDKPLHLSSARESGAIEESCDFMVGLHRPHIERREGREDDTMIAQLLKNRKGRCGQVTCNFEGETLRISERSEGVYADGQDEGAAYRAPDAGGVPKAPVRDDRSGGGEDSQRTISYRESGDRPGDPPDWVTQRQPGEVES